MKICIINYLINILKMCDWLVKSKYYFI